MSAEQKHTYYESVWSRQCGANRGNGTLKKPKFVCRHYSMEQRDGKDIVYLFAGAPLVEKDVLVGGELTPSKIFQCNECGVYFYLITKDGKRYIKNCD